ncbi:hypothetical protein ACYOEI_26805, partial [Singulisphaera rosea]
TLIIAQAAAVLIGVTLLWKLETPNPVAQAVSTMAVASPEIPLVTIEQEQTVLIELGIGTVRRRNVALSEDSNGVDDFVRFWNRAEATDEAMASLR